MIFSIIMLYHSLTQTGQAFAPPPAVLLGLITAAR